MTPENAPPRTEQPQQTAKARDNRALGKLPFIPVTPGYTKQELFELWRYFRGQRDEVTVMMDFALVDRVKARLLCKEFERKLTGETPDPPPMFPPAKHDDNDFMW